jgi:hypothetical protein
VHPFEENYVIFCGFQRYLFCALSIFSMGLDGICAFPQNVTAQSGRYRQQRKPGALLADDEASGRK